MRETWVQSLGWEDPLEKEMATHSSILAWRIPRMEEPGRLPSMRSQRVDTTERLHLSPFISQLHSSHTLVKWCSKFSKPGFSNTWTVNFQMFKLVLEKAEGTRDQIANICWIMEKAREFQKNIYFCSIDYAKAFDCVDHNKLWKILKEMGIPDHLTCLLRNLYAD